MHVHEKQDEMEYESNSEKSFEQVIKLYHTVMREKGPVNAYKLFNTKVFRENLSILDAIWNKLEPIMKLQITKIREKLCAKKVQGQKQSD